MDCYFQMGFGLFPDFFDKLENVSEIYPGSIPDILKMYSKHGQNISQICQNICQQMSRTYPTCLPDISKNVPQIDFWKNRFWGKSNFEKTCFMYGTSGVIHVWYIRCDRDAAAAGQPPGQSSHPAARARGPFVPGPGSVSG